MTTIIIIGIILYLIYSFFHFLIRKWEIVNDRLDRIQRTLDNLFEDDEIEIRIQKDALILSNKYIRDFKKRKDISRNHDDFEEEDL